MQLNSQTVWADFQKIRETNPLIHNITNYVVMNNTANALLALGASPIMAHAIEEVEELVKISGALVINIGTLSGAWLEAMQKAMLVAHKLNKPIVFDPVGVGATTYRTTTTQKLFELAPPTVIRGNASEICAILGTESASERISKKKINGRAEVRQLDQDRFGVESKLDDDSFCANSPVLPSERTGCQAL